MNKFGNKANSTYVRALRAGVVVKTINSSRTLMKVLAPIILEYACRLLGPWNEAVGTGNEAWGRG